MERKDRFYLDVVKGIAIFLMIWGHCIQYCNSTGSFLENPVVKMIYSFHMPLFMLVSGYLFFFSFEKRDLKTLLVHRTQAMLQPIVMGTILSNLLMELMYRMISQGNPITNGELFNNGLMSTYWFLWCVLASSILVSIACKTGKRGWTQGLLLLMGGIVITVFPGTNYQLFMYPYFVLGFLWAKYSHRIARIIPLGKWLVLLIYPVMLPFYQVKHYIYVTPMYSAELGLAGSAKIAAFRFLIGLAGSAFVLVLTDSLVKTAVKNGKIPKLLSGLSDLGANSLQIYVLSAPLLSGYLPVVYDKLTDILGYAPFGQNPLLLALVYAPLLSIGYAAGLYFVVWLMRKWKIHGLIFGR